MIRIGSLERDEQGVSPVIGVILMVAVTVILSAVVATFVLGIGDQINNSPPSVSFDYDKDSDTVTVTHQTGSRLDGDNVDLTVDGDGTVTTPNQFTGTITAGTSAKATGVSDGDVVRVVWKNEGSSAILFERTVEE